jgi:hypothetical protein
MDLAAENPVHATLGEVERRLGSRAEIELSILMPCLNEAETLAACIEKATGFLHRSGVAGEVIVADNGSTDASRDIARALGARVVEVAARGYGAALGAGIAAARGRYVIMGDSDDSYDFAALDGFVVKLRQGADLVMGNRFKGGIADQAMPRLHRYLGNPVLSFMGRLFFRSPIGDFHCGLRGFARAAILDLRLAAPGMEFASEMVVKATLAGLKVAEVPTTLKPDGRSPQQLARRLAPPEAAPHLRAALAVPVPRRRARRHRRRTDARAHSGPARPRRREARCRDAPVRDRRGARRGAADQLLRARQAPCRVRGPVA